MPTFAQCGCAQLTLEVSDNPIEPTHHLSPMIDGFIYFDNDSVVGTNGEAHCITMQDTVEGYNLYYCTACQSALFYVSLQNPSIIGVLKESFRSAIVLDFPTGDTRADNLNLFEPQDSNIA